MYAYKSCLLIAQVDNIDYFGKGQTIRMANNDCAANVLSAMDSGMHSKKRESMYKNAFDTLKQMYNGSLFQTPSNINNGRDGYIEVILQLK